MNGETELYRCYGPEGVLLYVGISLGAIGRLVQHRQQQDWWIEVTHISITRFPTREDARSAETAMIHSERPLFNIIENSEGMARCPAPGTAGFLTWCQRRASIQQKGN